MTRKDFELIAGVLRSTNPEPTNAAETYRWSAIVHSMAKALEDTDSKFRRDVFLKACGYKA